MLKRFICVIFIGLCLQPALNFEYEQPDSYTIFVLKPSGKYRPSNSELQTQWGDCEPAADEECVRLVPAELNEGSLRLRCEINHHQSVHYYDVYTNPALGDLIMTGTDDLENNFFEEVCGGDILEEDFVVITMFDSGDASSQLDTETSVYFQALMQAHFLEKPLQLTTAPTSKTSATLTVTVPYPPQGSQIALGVTLMFNNEEKTVVTWLDDAETDLCAPVEDHSESDPNYGESFTIATDVTESDLTDHQILEDSDRVIYGYKVKVDISTCDGDGNVIELERSYIGSGIVIFDKSDGDLSESGNSNLVLMEEDPVSQAVGGRWCSEDPSCEEAAIGASPAFLIGQPTYFLVEFDSSILIDDVLGTKLSNFSFGQDVEGWAHVTILDSSQDGRLIVELAFLKTFANHMLHLQLETSTGSIIEVVRQVTVSGVIENEQEPLTFSKYYTSRLDRCIDGDCDTFADETSDKVEVGDSELVLMTIEATLRNFTPVESYLVDASSGEVISGGIRVSVADASQPGEITFIVTFLKVYDDALLWIHVQAEKEDETQGISKLTTVNEETDLIGETAASRRVSIVESST